jgi:hypothetical protein
MGSMGRFAKRMVGAPLEVVGTVGLVTGSWGRGVVFQPRVVGSMDIENSSTGGGG